MLPFFGLQIQGEHGHVRFVIKCILLEFLAALIPALQASSKDIFDNQEG